MERNNVAEGASELEEGDGPGKRHLSDAAPGNTLYRELEEQQCMGLQAEMGTYFLGKAEHGKAGLLRRAFQGDHFSFVDHGLSVQLRQEPGESA